MTPRSMQKRSRILRRRQAGSPSMQLGFYSSPCLRLSGSGCSRPVRRCPVSLDLNPIAADDLQAARLIDLVL